jgi:hypothetical protein
LQWLLTGKKPVGRKGSHPGSLRRGVAAGVRSGKGHKSTRAKKPASVKPGTSSKVQVIYIAR